MCGSLFPLYQTSLSCSTHLFLSFLLRQFIKFDTNLQLFSHILCILDCQPSWPRGLRHTLCFSIPHHLPLIHLPCRNACSDQVYVSLIGERVMNFCGSPLLPSRRSPRGILGSRWSPERKKEGDREGKYIRWLGDIT